MGSMRAPAGQHDDRAVAYVLALQGRASLLRYGSAHDCGACLLTPGLGDLFGAQGVVGGSGPMSYDRDGPWL